ncbi:MAG: hypothetical protein ACTJLK_01540 [Anaplasma sp.]
MGLKEGWVAFRRGVSGLAKEVSQSKGAGALSETWNVLRLHVENFARLDPMGYGEMQKVRVPEVRSQLVDRSQYCEFLPPKCFKRDMRIDSGQLIVGGVGFPIEPINDSAGAERVVTCDNKLLYAINTNHQDKALKILGLSRDKYKNKRLVVACEGDRVVPIGGTDSDRKVMRSVYNSEVTVEVRRIKNRETGSAEWLLTFVVAMPCNLIASAANFLLMVPHGILHGLTRILDVGASRMRQEGEHRALARLRGTVKGAGSPWAYKITGLVLQSLTYTASVAAGLIGAVRRVAVSIPRSIPVLASAVRNRDKSQAQIAGLYLKESFSGAYNDAASVLKDALRGRMSAEESAELGGVGPIVSCGAGSDARAGAEGMAANAQQLRSVAGRNVPAVGEERPIVLNRSDMLKVMEAGETMHGSGLTVSYGTNAQLQENFITSGQAESAGLAR